MSRSSATSLQAIGRVGKVLRGKWTLLRVLGQGGTGTVYEAVHRNGFRAAIKVIHRSQSDDDRSRRRFQREARTSNRLRHRGVLLFYDEDQDEDGTLFLVMELLTGVTCQERLERSGPMPIATALRITDTVLSVLEVAHRRGTLHRDIKPQNVFLTTHNEVKLLDFGLARERPRSGTQRVSETAMTTFVVGTPAFMAPEQLRGELRAIDERTDLWAVGALLFTILTNHWPLEFDLAQLTRTGDRHLPSLAAVLPRAPASLVRLVDRALETDPALRWQDARSMRLALREVSRELKAPRQPPRLVLGLLATALASTLGLLLWTYRGNHRAPDATVSVSVSVSPPGSQLWLDGELLPSNPYRAHLVSSDGERELLAQAPGYKARRRRLNAHTDVEVEMNLEPLDPQAAPGASGSASARPAGSPAPR